MIVPRKPERFDEVARAHRHRRVSRSFAVRDPISCRRRPPRPIILGDTIGELRKFYALADVVFVGRTLVDLGHRQHGSDMIEPAALAKPVVVGPFTANFAEAMNHFLAADAMIVVQNPQELAKAIENLLSDPARARRWAFAPGISSKPARCHGHGTPGSSLTLSIPSRR